LNADELQQIREWKEHVNRRIAGVAERLRFILFDADGFFAEAKRLEATELGVPLQRLDRMTGRLSLPPPGELKRARLSWPKGDPRLPGVFGLDGIHPNLLGHTMVANAIINELNEQYVLEGGAAIRYIDEYDAWSRDSLNQHPIDLETYIGTMDTLRRDVLRILSRVLGAR
jgi:hypothetical protein